MKAESRSFTTTAPIPGEVKQASNSSHLKQKPSAKGKEQMADKKEIRPPLLNIHNFHSPGETKDKRSVNGRLIATVASLEIEPGKLAVAISRAAPEDESTRETGRMTALARLNRYIALKGNGIFKIEKTRVVKTKEKKDGQEVSVKKVEKWVEESELTEKQREHTKDEIERKLVLTMSVDDYKKEFVDRNPFLDEKPAYGIFVPKKKKEKE